MRVLVYEAHEHDGDGVLLAPAPYSWAALILKPDGTLWPVHCTGSSEAIVRQKAESFIRQTINGVPRKRVKRQAAPEPEVEEAI